MDEKKGMYMRGCIIAFAVVIALLAMLLCTQRVKSTLSEYIMDNMQEISEQNAMVIDRQLESIQKLLEGMSNELREYSGEDKGEILQYLESYVDVYGLKRIGFIYPDGSAYTTDGYQQDLSFRDFFKKSMEGKTCISDVITDSIGEPEEINVFSVPVYNETGDAIIGVLFATYRTRMLWEQLRVTSLSGKASSFVVRSDGIIMAGSDGNSMDITSNIFQSMLQYQQNNQEAVKQIRSDMQQMRSGRTEIYYESNYFLSYVPATTKIDDSTWYVITIVADTLLEERAKKIWLDMEKLLAILIIALVSVLVGYIYSYRKQKNALAQLAYCDPVTGGSNYEDFKEKCKDRKDMHGFLVTMDIGEFRNINNICGEEMGDTVIRSIWHVLLENVKPHELMAHISADRYILFLEGENGEILSVRIENLTKEISQIAERLNTPRIMPYFGIYKTFNAETVRLEQTCANQAKALAKARKTPNYAFYEEVNVDKEMENQWMESCFQKALDKKEFEVWFQPKFNPADNSIVGAEALVRWRDENGNLISPGKFIPLFERNGMIASLDTYVIEEVCVQLSKWKEKKERVVPVSVNVSRASLYYSDIVERYRQILDNNGIAPEQIQLEITESAAIHNSEIHQLVQDFRKAGFRLLLDDFGNGYSSLATLSELKFDVLKLDKSLIDCIGDYDGETLLTHIIKLAHSLRLKITAEGVELKEQVDFLRKLECDDIQGFYYSKPLPKEEFEVLL
ncbi:MAG: EAL domain-containing protein [Lachnospiraceae bacterium]